MNGGFPSIQVALRKLERWLCRYTKISKVNFLLNVYHFEQNHHFEQKKRRKDKTIRDISKHISTQLVIIQPSCSPQCWMRGILWEDKDVIVWLVKKCMNQKEQGVAKRTYIPAMYVAYGSLINMMVGVSIGQKAFLSPFVSISHKEFIDERKQIRASLFIYKQHFSKCLFLVNWTNCMLCSYCGFCCYLSLPLEFFHVHSLLSREIICFECKAFKIAWQENEVTCPIFNSFCSFLCLMINNEFPASSSSPGLLQGVRGS